MHDSHCLIPTSGLGASRAANLGEELQLLAFSFQGNETVETRTCVFVDGENLRHSLLDLFAEEGLFRVSEYLPPAAHWSNFFDWIVSAATAGAGRRVRTYWFVTQEIDCFPFGLNQMLRMENTHQLKSILCRHKPYREQLHRRDGVDVQAEIQKIVEQLTETQRRIESRFKGWTTVQNGICLRHRAVEFRRAGAISYNLFEERFGQEKAVDVRLACDMIMLRDIYDTAIIVSGDQDYVPAAQILKDSGKTVINIAFKKRNGDLLPGGARRLNIATDTSINVPYDKLESFMGLSGAPAPRDISRSSSQ